MENNIRAALEAGELVSGFTGDSPRTIAAPLLDEQEMGYPNNHHKPARIRTISGMDQVMVEALKERVPKPATTTQVQRPLRDAHGRPPLPSGRARSFGITSSGSSSSLELSPEDSRPPKPSLRAFTTDESADSLRGEALLDCLMDDGPLEQDVKLDTKPGLSRPQSLQNHMRRNTGGTIFVKSTMMNPNIEATIKVSRFFMILEWRIIVSFLTSSSLLVRLRCLQNPYFRFCRPTFQSITNFHYWLLQ